MEGNTSNKNPQDSMGLSQVYEVPITSSSCMIPVPEENSIEVLFKASRLLSTTTEKSKFFECTHQILRELSEEGLLPRDNASSSGGACWALVASEPKKKILPRLTAINIDNEILILQMYGNVNGSFGTRLGIIENERQSGFIEIISMEIDNPPAESRYKK